MRPPSTSESASAPEVAAPLGDAPPAAAEPQPRVYTVGTLRYTLGGLIELCFWLLLGDFAYNLIDLVIPSVLPLTLQEAHASNATIGLLVGTLGSIVNVIINPIVSFQSDRHRGSWGRRIPYILFGTPFIAVTMIGVGYADQMGNWLHGLPVLQSFSPTGLMFASLTVALILFQIFYLLAASVYYYLLNDVVPHVVIGRFYGLFRLVGAVGGFVFNRFILRYADAATTRRWIYISMGLVWLVCFLLMCWRVKEGEYPPPAPRAGGNIGNRVIKGIQTYVRECFSIPFYWWLYLASACYTMATVPFITFRLLLAKDLGMDLGQAGDLVSWIFVGGVVLYLPLGWLADKVHPLRLNFIGVMLTFIVLTLSSLLVHSPASFWLFTLLWAVAWLCFTASGPAMVFLLLPRERFGQFGSAIAISGSIAGALANYGGGRFVDWLGAIHVAGSPYRGVFWWGAAFSGMSLVCMVMLYRGWLARGGRKHFVAPKI